MRSMTGYGRGETTAGGARFTVEIQSVNRKQLDVVVNLPRELSTLDGEVRSLINHSVARGRVSVFIEMTTPEARQHLVVDHALAKQYHDAILELQKKLGMREPLSLEAILRSPGVLRTSEENLSNEEVWPHLRKALETALKELEKMRVREGKHLAKDLAARLKMVRENVRNIRKLYPVALKRYRDNLRERLVKAGFAIDTGDERLLRELAFFADRSDVSEELTRLESHLQQFTTQLRNKEPIGRPLEFLTQEIQREFNTLGAKANDAEISQCVVACKSEMEKIREQIQNIE